MRLKPASPFRLAFLLAARGPAQGLDPAIGKKHNINPGYGKTCLLLTASFSSKTILYLDKLMSNVIGGAQAPVSVTLYSIPKPEGLLLRRQPPRAGHEIRG